MTMQGSSPMKRRVPKPRDLAPLMQFKKPQFDAKKRRLDAAAGRSVRYSLDLLPSNSPAFLTEPDAFTELVAGAIATETGRRPVLSTTGGTSDARFIKDACPVLEFGLVGQTMHQTDECVPIADLNRLTAIYTRVLAAYFADR